MNCANVTNHGKHHIFQIIPSVSKIVLSWLCISTQRRVHLWMQLLNHTSAGHETRPTDKYSHRRYFSENICMLSRSGSYIFRHFLMYRPITIKQKPVMVSNQKPSWWDGDFLYFSRCALWKFKNIQHPQKCNRLHHIAILLALSKSLEVVFILHNRAKNKLGMFVVSCTIIRPNFILVILFLWTIESVSSNVK